MKMKIVVWLKEKFLLFLSMDAAFCFHLISKEIQKLNTSKRHFIAFLSSDSSFDTTFNHYQIQFVHFDPGGTPMPLPTDFVLLFFAFLEMQENYFVFVFFLRNFQFCLFNCLCFWLRLNEKNINTSQLGKVLNNVLRSIEQSWTLSFMFLVWTETFLAKLHKKMLLVKLGFRYSVNQ